MLKKFIKAKPGFTMIEVITVLLVIAIGMTGVLSLIVQNIRNQSVNKNTLIAYQLAQEGVELIRGVRDTNWRKNTNWNAGLGTVGAINTYYMDYTLTAPLTAYTPGSGKLILDNNGFYVSSPSSNLVEGNFYRIIAITYPDSANPSYMVVKSSVYWIERGSQHNYSLEAELYDWK